MASMFQCRLESHYLASARGHAQQRCLMQRSTAMPLCASRRPHGSGFFRRPPPNQHQYSRNRHVALSADEVAARTAVAHAEALTREQDLLEHRTVEEMRSRLIRHGFADQSLPADREALLKLLAEANLRARTQVVSFPLRKTPRSPRAIKSFLVAPIDVEDVGFVNFLLDSGSSGALITGELRESLGLSPSDGQVVKGVDSSGLTLRQKVRLPPLRLGPQLLDIRDAYVTTLKSDHDMDVGGVLGLNFLRMFEIEVCSDRQRMAFHPPGHIDKGVLEVEGMTRLDCEVLKGGLLGVPVSLNGSSRFPAILDLGANFSILNWPAAELAGVQRRGGGGEEGGGGAADAMQEITSIDGQTGSRIRRGFLDVVLGDEASPYVPSRALALMVRDIPSFAALGFGAAPVMVLGYDLLAADRMVLDLRNQRVYLK